MIELPVQISVTQLENKRFVRHVLPGILDKAYLAYGYDFPPDRPTLSGAVALKLVEIVASEV